MSIPPEGWPDPSRQTPVPYNYPDPRTGYPNGYAHGAPSYAVDPAAPFGRDPVTGQPLSDKTTVAAGCLQLFLGMFGAGRFYIGSTTIGGVQLGLTLFGFATTILIFGAFILFGMMIWSFVDAMMMFAGSVTDNQGRKLR